MPFSSSARRFCLKCTAVANLRLYTKVALLTYAGHMENNDFQLTNISQPSPPPVQAQVLSEPHPIYPIRVADTRSGPSKLSQDGLPSSNSHQDLHIGGFDMICSGRDKIET